MGNKIACTNCEKVSGTEGLVGWLQVEIVGVNVRGLGDLDPEGTFCSTACVIQWLRGEAARPQPSGA